MSQTDPITAISKIKNAIFQSDDAAEAKNFLDDSELQALEEAAQAQLEQIEEAMEDLENGALESILEGTLEVTAITENSSVEEALEAYEEAMQAVEEAEAALADEEADYVAKYNVNVATTTSTPSASQMKFKA